VETLGNVVEAILREDRYIPFSSCKSTHILSNAFGGDCKTLVLANIDGTNPANTQPFLALAQQIKTIRNEPTKNVESQELTRLKQHLLEVEGETDA
jgi:kinesin family protein 6/9